MELVAGYYWVKIEGLWQIGYACANYIDGWNFELIGGKHIKADKVEEVGERIERKEI